MHSCQHFIQNMIKTEISLKWGNDVHLNLVKERPIDEQLDQRLMLKRRHQNFLQLIHIQGEPSYTTLLSHMNTQHSRSSLSRNSI